jgi:thioredoxin reductase (NADPH)
MSRYLIQRIENNPKITLRTRTEIVGLEGNERLERVRVQEAAGKVETLAIEHVFLMTGATPNTRWLDGCVALDAKGFIKTGPDLTTEDLTAARWPLARAPHLLETSLPGVFAVGRRPAEHQTRLGSGRRGIDCPACAQSPAGIVLRRRSWRV